MTLQRTALKARKLRKGYVVDDSLFVRGDPFHVSGIIEDGNILFCNQGSEVRQKQKFIIYEKP